MRVFRKQIEALHGDPTTYLGWRRDVDDLGVHRGMIVTEAGSKLLSDVDPNVAMDDLWSRFAIAVQISGSLMAMAKATRLASPSGRNGRPWPRVCLKAHDLQTGRSRHRNREDARWVFSVTVPCAAHERGTSSGCGRICSGEVALVTGSHISWRELALFRASRRHDPLHPHAHSWA